MDQLGRYLRVVGVALGIQLCSGVALGGANLAPLSPASLVSPDENFAPSNVPARPRSSVFEGVDQSSPAGIEVRKESCGPIELTPGCVSAPDPFRSLAWRAARENPSRRLTLQLAEVRLQI